MKILCIYFSALLLLTSADQCKICVKNSRVGRHLRKCFHDGIKSKLEVTSSLQNLITAVFTIELEPEQNCWLELTRASDGHTFNVSTDGVPVEDWAIAKTTYFAKTPAIFLNFQSSFGEYVLGEYRVDFADGVSLDFHVLQSDHTTMNRITALNETRFQFRETAAFSACVNFGQEIRRASADSFVRVEVPGCASCAVPAVYDRQNVSGQYTWTLTLLNESDVESLSITCANPDKLSDSVAIMTLSLPYESSEAEESSAWTALSLPPNSTGHALQLEPGGASSTSVVVALCSLLGAVCAVALLVRVLRNPRKTLPWAKRRHKTTAEAGSHSPTALPSFFSMETMKTVSELGRGHFGIVYKAQLKDGRAIWTVAIKKALNASAEARLKKELEVMASIPFHVNIVNLQGVARDKDRLCLVLEFCHLGSLIHYLTANRTLLSDRLGTEHSGNAIRQTFIGLAQQIANGMWFLSSRCHVVHGDLAARNILLLSDNMKNITAKISDFGLAQMEGSAHPSEYQGLLAVEDGVDNVPVGFMAARRWAAPEALRERKASTYSDVWAFGITFWEIFSLGEVPYQDYEDSEVMELVEGGLHPSRPSACPTNVFAVMETCWVLKPTERPTFHQLLANLTNLLEDKQAYHRSRELANCQMLHTYMNVNENLVCNLAYWVSETGQTTSAGYLKMTGSSSREGPRIEELSFQREILAQTI